MIFLILWFAISSRKFLWHYFYCITQKNVWKNSNFILQTTLKIKSVSTQLKSINKNTSFYFAIFRNTSQTFFCVCIATNSLNQICTLNKPNQSEQANDSPVLWHQLVGTTVTNHQFSWNKLTLTWWHIHKIRTFESNNKANVRKTQYRDEKIADNNKNNNNKNCTNTEKCS